MALLQGILVTHAGLHNEIEGYTKTLGLGVECILQHSAFKFNYFSVQMYMGLVNKQQYNVHGSSREARRSRRDHQDYSAALCSLHQGDTFRVQNKGCVLQDNHNVPQHMR